jgi:hypothetical protein
MPELIADRSKARPTRPGRSNSTCGSRWWLTTESTIAPTTTPRIDPRPPSTTIAKMKIENENSNWAASTTLR